MSRSNLQFWLGGLVLWFCTPAVLAKQADWTLMIYMAADNNLEQAALIDLDEIEAGMPAEGVEIIVLIDRAQEYADGLGDWTDARVLRMRPDQESGKLASEELLNLGEINTGDPANLRNLINYSTSNFPARRYGLIMWDHGGGWQGMADDEDIGTKGEHDNLSLPELRQALSSAIPSGHKLDLIGFDMCLMAQVEIAYEVADFAEYMVASQAVEPGYGWPYDVLLPEFGKATVGPRRVAQNIVRRYGEYTENVSERVATQSAIELGRMGAVKQAIDSLANRLGPTTPQSWTALARSVFWADSFNPQGKDTNRRQKQSSLSSSDLLDLVKRARVVLGDRFPAETEFQKLVAAIDGAVVDSHTSARHKLSHGLSIYAPPSASTFNPVYEQTRFGASSVWPRLLKAMHQEQSKRSAPPKISYFEYVNSETGQPVPTTSMLDATTLRLKVEGNNLLWVQSLVGRYSAEDKGHLILSKGYMSDSRFLEEKLAATGDVAELLVPVFQGSTATMEMEVAPATYTVSNGEKFGFATIDSSEIQRGEGQSVAILAEYDSGELGKHQAIITFDIMTWQADGLALLVEMKDGRVVPRGIKPRETDTVTLLYEFIPDGEEEPSLKRGTSMPWKDGLELIMSEVPNGTYTTWAIAENLSGETHVATTSVRGVEPQWEVAAGFEGARKLSIRDLGGVWSDVEGNAMFAIGRQVGKGNIAELMINEAELPPEAKDWQFVVQLDNRLLPMISLLTFDAKGDKLLGRIPYMVLADPRQPDRLWIKSMIGGGGEAIGEVFEVVRTERLAAGGGGAGSETNTGGGSAGGAGSGTSSGGGGGTPGGGTTAPAASIVGVWSGTGEGGVQVWVQLMADGQFQQVETAPDQSMQIKTWGRYHWQNETMNVQYAGGEQCTAWGCQPFYPPSVAPFSLQLAGNTLQSPWALLYRQ